MTRECVSPALRGGARPGLSSGRTGRERAGHPRLPRPYLRAHPLGSPRGPEGSSSKFGSPGFSGPSDRPDGIQFILASAVWACDDVDVRNTLAAIGLSNDLLSDTLWAILGARVQEGPSLLYVFLGTRLQEGPQAHQVPILPVWATQGRVDYP